MHTLEQEPPQTLQLQQEEALASMMPTPLPPPPPSPLPQQPAPPLMMSHEDPQHVSMPPPSTPASVMFPQTPVQLGYPGTPAPSALGYPSTPAPPTPLHHMEEMPHLPPDQVNFVFFFEVFLFYFIECYRYIRFSKNKRVWVDWYLR
jgi:hypothetical protein